VLVETLSVRRSSHTILLFKLEDGMS
jgi:hypothetical protein